MAGRPRLRACQIELEHRRQAMRDEGELDATCLDYVCRWIENGGTILSLADDLSTYTPVPVERSQIMGALNREFGSTQTAERLAAARQPGAHALVEKALTIVDDLDKREGHISREDVARAKLQADTRLWTAGKWNHKELGDSGKGTAVTVNVQSLHLDALRAHSQRRRDPLEVAQAVSVSEIQPQHALPATLP